MGKISEKILKFIMCAMENRGVELTAGEKILAEVKIPIGIFQGDSLSLVLFVIARMPFIYVLRKSAGDNKFTKSQKNGRN